MSNTFHRHVDVQECEDAEALLWALRPRPEGYRDAPRSMIYRGVGDAIGHRLIPGALRSDALAAGGLDASTVHAIELDTLRRFVDACDRTGLRVPEDGLWFRDTLRIAWWQERKEWPLSTWPLPVHFKVWAVAQHHRLRTRLLDWTRNPLVAAYFAARSCLATKRKKRGEAIAVWTLDCAGHLIWSDRLAVVEIPADHSPNLAAQSGLFTVTLTPEPAGKPTPPALAVDDVIRACTFAQGMPSPPAPNQPDDRRRRPEVLMTQYTLAAEHAADVLDLCRGYGITGATMFPGYDGAVLAVEEHELCFEESRWRHSHGDAAPVGD